jgi:epoxyqueuosine reductase
VRRPEPLPTLDELRVIAADHGIAHLGVAPAEVLARARVALHDRKAAGLHDTMQFTYRNPDRSTDPQRAVVGARSILVAARSYAAAESSPATATEVDRPIGRIARYARVDHYAELRVGLRAIARRLRRSDERAVAFADDNSIVDREVAVLGGLGWFGKSTNVLVPGAGSWFVLGSVVTTADYPVSDPVADGCGTCRRCLDGCPTGAIVAPGVVDARRCLSWLLQRPGTFPIEYRAAVGDRFYGCDDCQEVCPPTVRLGSRAAAPPTTGTADVVDVVDLLEVLEATDQTLIERFGRFYLHERDPRWWRRNALVILGNVARPDDQATAAILDHYRRSADPILSEHAEWAIARLGERSLV